MDNIAFLELKYGNIYGGYPNFYAISEVSLLVFEPTTNRIFLESMPINVDVDIINVFSKTNELGNTIGKMKEVYNMKTHRSKPFDESYQLSERDLDQAFFHLRPGKKWVKSFFMKNFQKYRFRNIITFDGRRDVFLCEKSFVDFRGYYIHDLQKDITKETNYLFSLNKLARVIGFQVTDTHVRSNNCQYRLHPIAAKQIVPGTAAWDAARLLMVHQEFKEHKDDFLMKAALLLNKIETTKKD